MRNLSMLLLILLPTLILGQGSNSYLEIEDEEPETLQRIKFQKGQRAWDFDLVKNHHQSPINIKTGKIQILDCDDDNNLVLSYVTDRNIRYILRNNGHGVEVVMDEEELRRKGESIRPHLSGGILPETYVFENLHFHWGQNNFLGSEHTIDKQGFSFEIHMVTFKESYRTFTNAVTFKDGIVVLTFFAEVGRPNNAMNSILRYLPNVQRNGTQTPIVGTDAVVWFAEQVRSINRDYIAYPGSLTTPPYAETVTFFILPTPIPMSQDQLQQFRNLQGTNGTRLSSYRRERQFNLRQRPIVFVPHNFELYHTPLTNSLPGGPDEEDEEGHHEGEPDIGGTWSD